MMHSSSRLRLPLIALFLASLACNFGRGSSDLPDDSSSNLPTQAAATPVPDPTSTQPPAPTATQPPPPTVDVPLGEIYRSDDGGFAFQQLAGWEVVDEAGFYAYQPPDADPELGPVILLSPQIYPADQTIDQAFDNFLLGFDTDGGGVMLGTPFDLEIGGYPARAVDITGAAGSTDMLGQILVVSVGPRQALEVFGYAVADRWASEISGLYEAFTGSLTFFDPVAAETTVPGVQDGDVLRQWAGFAEASTQYGETSWSASQATGAPDVYPDCGDFSSAWAMADYETLDWLEVKFPKPVIPLEINIYQTYNPGRVVGIEVIDLEGEYSPAYAATAETLAECPVILTVYPEFDDPIVGLLIFVDTVGLGDWAEIDAVELVGFPAGP